MLEMIVVHYLFLNHSSMSVSSSFVPACA